MRPRLVGPLAATLLLGGVFATGLGLGQLTDVLPALSMPQWGRAAPTGVAAVRSPSPPVRIVIPAIGVRAPVHPVGLGSDGAIAVPPLERLNQAGWYDRGPAPGQDGPAIIVGHVDGKTKPAVFHRLGALKPGELVEVTRRDRRVAVFRVDSVERFAKERLPVDRIYGDFTKPGLRIITCGGPWVGGLQGYADNVIVFATLQATHRI